MATAAPSLSAESVRTTSELRDNVVIEEARSRESQRLRARSRWSAVLCGALFFVAAGALASLVHTHRPLGPWTVFGFVAGYALCSRTRFEVGTGLVLPTQLLLVPMLFLLPLGLVPLFVAAGLLLGTGVDVLHGKPLERLLLVPLHSWHAIGPTAVLAAAGEATPALRHWWLYAAALGAQFLTDYAVNAPRDRLVNAVPLPDSLRYMSLAFAVDAALAPIGLVAALAASGHAAAVALVLPLIGLLSVFARERQMRIDHGLELSHAYRGTALLLGDVVEADDVYTGSHSRDVVSLVLGVCDRVALPAGDRRDAEFAALLHDVGKIKIPPRIINKAGPLDAAERALIETHTVEGERLLSQVGGLLGNVGRIVRSCHEDWDGSGYPDRLAGEQIPLAARIVRCCDAFSAITSDRPYRAGRSVDEAIVELRLCSGTDFDPAVVEALVATLLDSEPVSE